MKINMDVGLDGPLDFAPDTILTSCVFYWGKYNPAYPFDSRGYNVKERNQIEFTNIPVRDLQWVIDEMRKLNK